MTFDMFSYEYDNVPWLFLVYYSENSIYPDDDDENTLHRWCKVIDRSCFSHHDSTQGARSQEFEGARGPGARSEEPQKPGAKARGKEPGPRNISKPAVIQNPAIIE